MTGAQYKYVIPTCRKLILCMR